MINVLDAWQKRQITFCNFNEHTDCPHPDRVMDKHDLIYIREGEWDICQEGTEYHVVKGDVILLQGGYHHYGVKACRGKVKTIYVHFDRCPGDRVVDKVDCPEGNFCFPMVVHCEPDSMAEKYLRQLIFSYWSEEPLADRKAAAYLELLLCEIDRQSLTERLQKNRVGRNALVDTIRMQIRNTPDRFYTVKELAEQYGCSERSLSGYFKAATGMGIHAWQLRLKCQMAEELMAQEPAVTLKEIAGIYGFCDEYHFSKCYKKQYGHAPKKGSRNEEI